ncbi:MAG TPA: MnhB domain-containing protein [Pirellulales bacterium]|nr:MnhB domain-containing protein [Pirellulales bacterium]
MTHRIRVIAFLAAAAVAAVLLLRGLGGMPEFGAGHSPYRQYLNEHAVAETHATDLPSAVNFSYRALDTLGEEYILFASVAGVAVLLREPHRGKKPAKKARVPDDCCPEEAVVAVSRAVVTVVIVFGFYVTIHAHLTPGGGFQGGAILGTGILLIYLADGHEAFAQAIHPSLVHALEAAGAAGYVSLGLAAMLGGKAFLENILPLGETGQFFSAGIVPLISLAVGLEVSGGFSSLFVDFISELHRSSEESEP